MKHIKEFEKLDLIENDRERILSDVAIYLEDILDISEDDGFIDCLYSDRDYEDKKVVYYEFNFDSTTSDEDNDDKFETFIKKNKLGKTEFKYIKINNYKGIFSNIITLKDNRIDKLYKDSEIYFATKKYNL